MTPTDYKKVAETLNDERIRNNVEGWDQPALDAAIALCEAAGGPENERESCCAVIDRALGSMATFEHVDMLSHERVLARAEGYAKAEYAYQVQLETLQAKYDDLVKASARCRAESDQDAADQWCRT